MVDLEINTRKSKLNLRGARRNPLAAVLYIAFAVFGWLMALALLIIGA